MTVAMEGAVVVVEIVEVAEVAEIAEVAEVGLSDAWSEASGCRRAAAISAWPRAMPPSLAGTWRWVSTRTGRGARHLSVSASRVRL